MRQAIAIVGQEGLACVLTCVHLQASGSAVDFNLTTPWIIIETKYVCLPESVSEGCNTFTAPNAPIENE